MSEEGVKKITFSNLSRPLQTLVVMGWVYLSYLLLVFLVYFLIGFIEGITGTILL